MKILGNQNQIYKIKKFKKLYKNLNKLKFKKLLFLNLKEKLEDLVKMKK